MTPTNNRCSCNISCEKKVEIKKCTSLENRETSTIYVNNIQTM